MNITVAHLIEALKKFRAQSVVSIDNECAQIIVQSSDDDPGDSLLLSRCGVIHMKLTELGHVRIDARH